MPTHWTQHVSWASVMFQCLEILIVFLDSLQIRALHNHLHRHHLCHLHHSWHGCCLTHSHIGIHHAANWHSCGRHSHSSRWHAVGWHLHLRITAWLSHAVSCIGVLGCHSFLVHHIAIKNNFDFLLCKYLCFLSLN